MASSKAKGFDLRPVFMDQVETKQGKRNRFERVTDAKKIEELVRLRSVLYQI